MKKTRIMIATAAAALLLSGGAATIATSTAYASTDTTSDTTPAPSPTSPPTSPWEAPVKVYVLDSEGERLRDSNGNYLTVDSEMAPPPAPSDVSDTVLTGKVSIVVDDDGVLSEGQEVEDRP